MRQFSLPKAYCMTELYLIMRSAERFGQHPFEYEDSLTPGRWAAAIAYERIRLHEEAARCTS